MAPRGRSCKMTRSKRLISAWRQSMANEGLEVRALKVSRGGRPVLRQVSLRVEPGRVTALLGANGAGKSTLVLTMAGALRPDAGQVLIDGSDFAGKRPEVIRMAGVAA